MLFTGNGLPYERIVSGVGLNIGTDPRNVSNITLRLASESKHIDVGQMLQLGGYQLPEMFGDWVLPISILQVHHSFEWGDVMTLLEKNGLRAFSQEEALRTCFKLHTSTDLSQAIIDKFVLYPTAPFRSSSGVDVVPMTFPDMKANRTYGKLALHVHGTRMFGWPPLYCLAGVVL